MVFRATVGEAICGSAVLCATNEQSVNAPCSICVETIPFCSKAAGVGRRRRWQVLIGPATGL
jgi:hypothetical protein